MQLNFRDAVRLRPGMYIGGTDRRSLHHLVYEIMDNSVEEAYLGGCDQIELILRPNAEIYLCDNSEGLPVDIDTTTGLPKLELIMTSWVSKSQFKKDYYRITGGLHGLGLAPINMLSSLMIVEVARDGYLWRQRYTEGKVNGPLEQTRPLRTDESTGTAFTFRPDFTIFDVSDFSYEMLATRCRTVAYQIPNLKITLRDERNDNPQESTFFAKYGLKSLMLSLTEGHRLHEPLWNRFEVSVPRENQTVFELGVEIAFVFTKDNLTREMGFVNTVETEEGGTHVHALRKAILRVLNGYRFANYENEPLFTWRQISLGLTTIISIRHPEPIFVSPTKIKLGNPRILDAVTEVIYEDFRHFADRYPKVMKTIIKNCIADRNQES